MTKFLAPGIVSTLASKGLRLAIAESLTGGALSAAVVDEAGASQILLGSIVAYNTALKSSLLGVSLDLLERAGAVDAEVAAQMASGARTRLAAAAHVEKALTIGLACTGVAGPDSQDGKSVGTVFIALDGPNGCSVREFHFEGDRGQIRAETVRNALELLAQSIS